MIQLIIGPPRSGKSYYAVERLITKYYDYVHGIYLLKKDYENLKIVTNIDGLKLPHEDLVDWIRKAGGPDVFFSYDFQEKVKDKYPLIVYVVDECHVYFPNNYKQNRVFDWFSYHGHWGQDIFLITQAHANIPKRISALCENYIYALPQSTSFLGGKDLNYNVVSGREIVDKIKKIKKQRIFALYKSHDQKSVEKVKNPLVKYWLIFICIAFLVLIKIFYNLFSAGGLYSNKEKVHDVNTGKTVKESSVKNSHKLISTDSKIVAVNYIKQGGKVILNIGNTSWTYSEFPYLLKVDAYNRTTAEVPNQDLSIYYPPIKKQERTRSTESEQANASKKRG